MDKEQQKALFELLGLFAGMGAIIYFTTHGKGPTPSEAEEPIGCPVCEDGNG